MNQEVSSPKNSRQILYFDMDGVLVDFDKSYEKLTGGLSLRAYSKKVGDKPAHDIFLDAGTKYWADMDWVQGGRELFAAGERLFSNIWILSSAGTTSPELAKTVIQGKREWLQRHLPQIPMSKVLVVLGRHRKKEYAAKNAILIDDMPDTIESWNKRGGSGILHDFNNYKKSIEALEDLAEPIKLRELASRFV
jgi:phosphoglycolate phosphatase-like HAD superfamily hydrolase